MKRTLLKLAAVFCATIIMGIYFCSAVSANTYTNYQLPQGEQQVLNTLTMV